MNNIYYLVSTLINETELIVGVGLKKPILEVSLILIVFLSRRRPFVGNVEKSVKVGEEIDSELMLLVQLVSVERFYGFDGVGMVAELEKDETFRLAVLHQRVVLVHNVADLGKDFSGN